MKRSTLSVAAWLVLVFVSGVLVGVFGQRLYSAKTVNADRPRMSPEEFRRQYVNDMRTRLHLTQEQVQSVNKILDETKVRFDAVRDRFRPEMKAIQDDQHLQIRGVLNETQQADYEKMLAERERERQRQAGNQGGSGGRH